MDNSVSENLFAGLDIGSHTTRMLIARKSGSQLVPVCAEKRVTRLAEGFQRAGRLTEEAQRRNIEALKEYVGILGEHRVARIFCGATGVVRQAENSAQALERISAETGVACTILSEESEARLSAKAILSVIRPEGKEPLLFDVGGGSTELVLPVEKNEVLCTSRPVGAATLTQAYLGADPPGPEAVSRAAIEARKQIDAAKEHLYASALKKGKIIFSGRALLLAGTAGTVTTLAAMHLGMKRYVPYRVNGVVLAGEWLSRTIESLTLMPLAERRRIAGLEAGREDIILGGAVIVSQILACFGSDSLIVSDAGLVEGLVIELAERESGSSGGPAAGPTTDLTWRLPKR